MMTTDEKFKETFAALAAAIKSLIPQVEQVFNGLVNSIDVQEFRKYERNHDKAVARSRRNNENRRKR